jgi:RNA binding exosome subunit
MSSAVQSLEVSYFIQMTEDEEKVKRAVAAMVGGGEELPQERQEAQGHHGNKIVWVMLHLTGDGAEAALRQIVSRIDPDERRAILGDLGALVDEHNALYMRLSKQVLVMRGSAVLASSDPIRVKVKPRSYMVKGDPKGFYARLFEGSA